MNNFAPAQPFPPGPFPRSALCHPLERRWLHYAFLTRDGSRALVANIAWLGDEERSAGLRTAILLTHERETGWSCSQWNAAGPAEPWSSFRLASPPRLSGSREAPDFELAASKGWPWARLRLQPTSTPGVGGCATFQGDHWQRWQAEPGVLARGLWRTGPGESRPFEAVGYHERVRGRWGWPEMGGWVFGFCNHAPEGLRDGRPPEWSIVFALLQPGGEEMPGQTCVLMLWRRGRLIRFIPRRSLRVTAAGQLERDRVETLPAQMSILGTGPTAAIPAALCLDGYQGRDWVQLRFRGRAAARLVVPSESSLRPYSVHEVIGEAEVELDINARRASFRSPAIVEFAGGAAEGSWDGP